MDIEFDDLFADNFPNDESVNYINPDEFLNLDEFQEIKRESAVEFNDTYGNYSYAYTSHIPPQLTPPLSPTTDCEKQNNSVNSIPTRKLQQNVRKDKLIIPKPSSSSDSDSNAIVIDFKRSTLPNDKALLKQQRQIRNRESAILSRNKKKVYVETLEEQNVQLRIENSILKAENVQLKEEFNRSNSLKCGCAVSVKRKLPSKNVTVMLAVCFMVGINILPFGNFVFRNSVKEQNDLQKFEKRHLLFVDNSSMNASNESKSAEVEDENIIYLNQTEQIRKVNIDNIRRWIPEPDLFNVSNIKKDFEFNPDPLQEKLTKMYEKSRQQSQKYVKNVPKKKTIIGPTVKGPVQLYNSNKHVIKLNEFFDDINRKDDTFYVFSFNSDHLLLPAIDNSYNFSQIKMNLIMPKSNKNSSSSEKIQMMQIETIIINTSLIQIKSIPENFLKSGNTSTSNMSQLNMNDEGKIKKNSNHSRGIRPLKDAAKFPSIKFNTLDFLKPAT